MIRNGRVSDIPRAPSAAPNLSTGEPSSTRKGKGRPKKPITNKGESAVKRRRGRPRKTTVPFVTFNAPPSTKRKCASAVIHFASTTTHHGRTRARAPHPLESRFTRDVPITNVAPKETAATKGREKGVGNTTQYKRPRVTGMGVFQVENGFKTYNLGLPSRRIVST